MAFQLPKLTLKRKVTLTLCVTALGAAVLAVIAVGSLGSLNATTRDAELLSRIHNTLSEARATCLEMALGHRTGYSELLDNHLPALEGAAGELEDPAIREALGSFVKLAGSYAEGYSTLEEVRTTATEANTLLLAGVAAAHGRVDGAVVGAWVATATGSGLVVLLAAALWWVAGGAARRTDQMVGLLRDLASGEGDLTRELPMAYIDCSKAKDCGHDECACFGHEEACWSHVGSMQPLKEKIQCPAVLSGKVTDCSECEVFEAAVGDEFDATAAWINVFIAKVRYLITRAKDVVVDLSESADLLSTTATELSATNQSVSGQVQQVASAAEEMIITVQEAAENVGEVSRASDAAHETSSDAVMAIGDMVTSVGKIRENAEGAAQVINGLSDTSEEIGTFVAVINEIADQTNLLALNAAIEAARAGDHGRGFAVVADEVRKLAEKTTRATTEISSLISSIRDAITAASNSETESMAAVEEGAQTGEFAAGKVAETEGEIQNAAGMAQQIATATEQLAATVREVAASVSHISEATTENTSAVDGVAGTAETAAAKANELREITDKFRT